MVMKLTQEFYTRESVTQIARELLGKIIFTQINGKLTGGMITETEAYAGVTDKASHAYNNRRTKRTEIMYSKGGVAYIYLCYGVHHLFNFVTNQKDIPHAVLLRGIFPVTGISEMENRTGKKFQISGFSDGPGKLSKALGISIIYSGENLERNRIWVEDHEINILDGDINIGPRIGVFYSGEDAFLPYRYLLKKDAIQKYIEKKSRDEPGIYHDFYK